MQATALNPVMTRLVATEECATPMVACLLITPYGVPAAEWLELAEALRARCARMSDRVIWLGKRGQTWPDGALLDLGRRSASEAQAVCAQLMGWLVAQRLTARIGAGSTQTLAQLAALRTAPGVTRVVDPEQAQAFIQRFPVDTLSGLASDALTPALVARLREAGLRTLGEVALLDARDPAALRRQFGEAPGAYLTLIAQGNDPCPSQLAPTPPECACAVRAF